FHTRQGFRLDAGTLRARIQSNPVEKDMLEGTATEPSLSARGATGPWGIDATPLREALQSIDGPGVMRDGIIVALLALLSGCFAATEPSVPFRQVRPAGLLTQGFACQTRLRAIADAAEFNVLMAG